nr:linear gramicidin synthase subunit D [uncultured bacterium]
MPIAHGALAAYTTAACERYALDKGDRVLQFASLGFDASIEEIFPCLVAGATLVLRTDEMIETVRAFLATCDAWGITLLSLPTAFWHELVAAAAGERLAIPRALRMVILGGERVLRSRVEEWRGLDASHVELVNTYGPTEATVVATAWTVPGGGEPLPREVPIGRPLPHVRAVVVDAAGQPAPIGVPGELCLGGEALARGYHGHPELTAAKFVRDPFGRTPDARLYRTGDQARWLDGGNLEFLGRLDGQVKLRGFRVELGEIESALRAIAGVRDAAVVALEDRPGELRLVAYVVPGPQRRVPVDELRGALRTRLPAYMIPAAFVTLDALPLTTAGKVDRRALPAPDAAAAPGRRHVPPSTPTEATLAEIWSSVLGVEAVGAHDDFFALGGHSLLATRVIARVRDAFGIDLPLRALFEVSTVAEIARRIDECRHTGALPSSGIDVDAESALDPAIRFDAPRRHVASPEAALLTGATGFVGAFLLDELLRTTSATVHCLVRADDAASGRARIREALTSYGLWDDARASRIVPVVGDLARPRLGLSAGDFRALGNAVDVIYHNGALVSLVAPYSQLKAGNVLGTHEVLRLAAEGGSKPVHYVSTCSVFGGPSYRRQATIVEDEAPKFGDELQGGYAQSKYVAEQLVYRARARGLQCVIYRLGRVTGHSGSGACNTGDLTCRLIKGYIQLGSMPELPPDSTGDMVPVDFAARSIVHLSRRESSLGHAFHIVNPRQFRLVEVLDAMRAFGYPLRSLPPPEWKAALVEQAQDDLDHPLHPFVARLAGADDPPPATSPRIACDDLLAAPRGQ